MRHEATWRGAEDRVRREEREEEDRMATAAIESFRYAAELAHASDVAIELVRFEVAG